MKVVVLFFFILSSISCSKGDDPDPDLINDKKVLIPFTVKVIERLAETAIIKWTAAPDTYSADTVKYDIVLNGKKIRADRTKNIDTLTNLCPDSAYIGRVYARSLSGDTASAVFELEKIGGYIVFGDFNGSIQCFNLYSGTRLWQTPYPYNAYYFHGIPLIVDSSIYVNSNTHGLFAINAKTGATLWNNQFDEPGAGSTTSPVYKDGKIYTVTRSAIYGVDSSNGQTVWSFSEAKDEYQSNPVISNNLLFEYASGTKKKIVAVNIKTGTKDWEYITDYQISENPVIYNNLLIFGASDGGIYALYHATGRLAWSHSFRSDYNNAGSHNISPKIFKDLVIVQNGNSGYYGLSASTGAIVWNYSFGRGRASSPAIGNGLLYFSVTNSQVVALDAATGVTVWLKMINPDVSYSTPIFAKNRLYLDNHTWVNGIPVLDAANGTLLTTIAKNITQVSPVTVVAGDSVFYVSQSGMVQ